MGLDVIKEQQSGRDVPALPDSLSILLFSGTCRALIEKGFLDFLIQSGSWGRTSVD